MFRWLIIAKVILCSSKCIAQSNTSKGHLSFLLSISETFDFYGNRSKNNLIQPESHSYYPGFLERALPGAFSAVYFNKMDTGYMVFTGIEYCFSQHFLTRISGHGRYSSDYSNVTLQVHALSFPIYITKVINKWYFGCGFNVTILPLVILKGYEDRIVNGSLPEVKTKTNILNPYDFAVTAKTGLFCKVFSHPAFIDMQIRHGFVNLVAKGGVSAPTVFHSDFLTIGLGFILKK